MITAQTVEKADKLRFKNNLFARVINTCKQSYPNHVRGLFTTKDDPYNPDKVYFFKDNLRLKDDTYNEFFEKFGPYYKKHRGFVTNPMELLEIEKEIKRNNETICGIFHVHIDFPACPTRLDIETFYHTVLHIEKIWYLIISFLNPEEPDARVYWIKNKLIQEIEMICE